MTERPDTTWLGELWLAEDHGLLLGTPGRTREHAHYAHQVLIAREGELCVEIEGCRQQGPLLAIASLQAHAVISHETPCITLFAEPLAFSLETLASLCRLAAGNAEHLAGLLRDCPRRVLDPRLAKALARIRAMDEQTLPAAALAREASLSLSQLERLFSGSLGLSVRRLVLWQRLRLALQRALTGDSLTEAAMAAGFADSAHLSRSLRQQFGIRASDALRHLRSRPFA
ncbi:helix-turn-helix domain-containing protein [Pseudomonas sp. GD03858]|uniref:helix-turn-helix domain-containing protein n=1 Tax=unclassified Pseudomonas TaxID=196821 RepID=UPI00244C68C4|nr:MULTISPECIES: helix-turn-helix domain-containing protein [unclassified Pseudomonas]MDH0647544.1 helix-turn-helix domain-containing protein [Pseudomonas sp. GD03867]MDH0663987.1 helix-turn-helix domain-containing protein [Pseudomonas sp. GD03858]